jgi:hypothetical protein
MGGGITLRGAKWKTDKNLSQSLFVHHKSQIGWPWREPSVADGSLFNDAFSVTKLYIVDGRVISEWRRIGKNLVRSGRAGIRQEKLRKATENLDQDSRWQGQRPRFEPGTFRIWSRGVCHSTRRPVGRQPGPCYFCCLVPETSILQTQDPLNPSVTWTCQ